MVVPMPGDELLQQQPVPVAVRENHYAWWWVLLALLVCLMTVQILAEYLFAAVYTSLIAYIVFFNIRDSCKEMSPMCVQCLGFVCLTMFVFDTALLCTMLGGRREQETQRTHYDPKQGESTFRVKITTRPFFDEKSGHVYNLQSVSRLVSPLVMLLGVVLCYKAHVAYEQEFVSRFGMDTVDAARLEAVRVVGAGGGGLPAAGYGATGGGGAVAAAAGGPGGGGGGGGVGGGGRQGGSYVPFSGQGQRLGDTDA